jgi:hypothetical protein
MLSDGFEVKSILSEGQTSGKGDEEARFTHKLPDRKEASAS